MNLRLSWRRVTGVGRRKGGRKMKYKMYETLKVINTKILE